MVPPGYYMFSLFDCCEKMKICIIQERCILRLVHTPEHLTILGVRDRICFCLFWIVDYIINVCRKERYQYKSNSIRETYKNKYGTRHVPSLRIVGCIRKKGVIIPLLIFCEITAVYSPESSRPGIIQAYEWCILQVIHKYTITCVVPLYFAILTTWVLYMVYATSVRNRHVLGCSATTKKMGKVFSFDFLCRVYSRPCVLRKGTYCHVHTRK